jgi:hypothetical protein
MRRVEFEPSTPASERTKTVDASDSDATVIGERRDSAVQNNWRIVLLESRRDCNSVQTQ